ncbi:hypothetical protein QCA50_016764 [Cerrena zonata]|uniref:Protein kinase domain-containing protein n=1 Tax=Cerrena zonata TaxID=2478898 RepID=A0AAW0FMH6_9APHY
MRTTVFKKLIPITDTTVKDLTQPFLETVQCHALLWSLGILHGDLSVTNLMVDPENKKGILVDFDLATVAHNDTIDACPLHGNDRTGTMAFMALELLREEGLQGKIPRLYRHDLESFCWVFLWICYCYDNGKFMIHFPFGDWIDTTPRSCRGAKFAVIGHLQETKSKPTLSYAQYVRFSIQVVRHWVYFYNDRAIAKLHKDHFEEPGEMQMLRSILELLPPSPNVEMQWTQAYTHITPSTHGSE